MKRLEDYTNEELLTLDEAGINTLIALETAHAGVEFAPEAPPMTLEDPRMQPCGEVYECAGCHFSTTEDAEEVATLVRSKQIKLDYDWTVGSNFRYLDPDGDPGGLNISTVRIFDRNELKVMEARLKAYKNEKESRDSLVSKRNRYETEMDNIRANVNDAIYGVQRHQQTIDAAKAQYTEFLMLAEGDAIIAQKFFYNAFKNAERSVLVAVIGEDRAAVLETAEE